MQPNHPYSAQPYPQAITLVHTSRNTPAIIMGCISVLLGVVALLFCWVPFLGMISLPFAGVGGLLAVIGFIVAACRSFIGWVMPVIGGVLCLIALVVCIAITSAAGSAVAAGLEQQQATQKARSEELQRESDRLQRQLTPSIPQLSPEIAPPQQPKPRPVPNGTSGLKF